MRLRKLWLIGSLLFFAVFLTVSAIIIVRGGDPIETADRAAQSAIETLIDPVTNSGGYRLLVLDEDSRWRQPAEGFAPPERVVLLIHGLDEPGTIFDDLAPAIAAQDLTPIYFEYPNDQRIADSTALLRVAMQQLHRLGVERVDLVCHSMGGLVSRDYLTSEPVPGTPTVERWITVGTPYNGAPLAGLRLIAEWREQAVRWSDSVLNGGAMPSGTRADGAGEAGEDLKPDSAFLTDLNARPMPSDVRTTVIYGVLAPGVEIAGIGDELGDGVVPVWSAIPDGATDVVKLGVNHRAMLKSAAISQAARNAVGATPREAPAIPVILDRLNDR